MFFFTIFYRSFPIFLHNFYIKIKKKRDKWTRPETPSPMWTKSIQMFFVFFYFPYSLGRVQYSIVKLFIFYFYPHPLRKRESTDGHFLLLLQLFPTSNFLFLPGWKKPTSFIATRDPWPTRHYLTSSPSYVITSVCDSFSDRISNLTCIVVNVLRPGHSHVYSHGR